MSGFLLVFVFSSISLSFVVWFWKYSCFVLTQKTVSQNPLNM